MKVEKGFFFSLTFLFFYSFLFVSVPEQCEVLAFVIQISLIASVMLYKAIITITYHSKCCEWEKIRLNEREKKKVKTPARKSTKTASVKCIVSFFGFNANKLRKQNETILCFINNS